MAIKGQAMPTTVIQSHRAKISDGKSVRVTATIPTEASKFYHFDGFIGAAFQSVEAGEEVILNIEQAEYETDQLGDGDFKVGTPIFFDGKEFSTDEGIFAGTVTQEKDEDGVILFIKSPQGIMHQAPTGGNE